MSVLASVYLCIKPTSYFARQQKHKHHQMYFWRYFSMWSLPITGSHVFILHIALFNANLIYLYAEKREPGLCWFVYELQPKQWRKWMKPVWSFLTVVYLHFITKPRWTHQILEFQELDERFINNHLERWSQKLKYVEFYWLSFLLLPW